MQLTIQLTPEGQKALANIAAFPSRLSGAVVRGLDLGLEVALARTLRTRFTGKGAFPVSDHRLGVVTGRLRGSMERVPASVNGGIVSAGVRSNVKYFGAHEFGFSGNVTVKSHQRKAVLGDRFSLPAGGTISRVTGRRAGLVDRGGRKSNRLEQSSSRIATVKQHTRRVNIPARAPLSHGLQEHVRQISTAISSALVAEWKGGQS